MNIRYTIFDPTRNITLLTDTPVPRERQPLLAAELMRRLPAVEQVGFLEPPSLPGARLRLQMMGGEFCGNAAMSAAVWLAERDRQNGSPASSTAVLPLEVSGYPGVLRCRLEPLAEGGWSGTAAMPLPQRLGEAVLPGMGTVPAVYFPGIVHCVVPAGDMTRAQAEAAIRPLCAALGANACGILLWNEAASAFTPLVYVASSGTLVWESGCGSGSAALGVYLTARAGGSRTVSLRQPGGVITVHADWDGQSVAALSITGRVCRLEGGEMPVSV